MKHIYLDNAAATRPDKAVQQVMDRVAKNLYANPSSFNEAGRLARKELDKARLAIARFLSAREDEVIFTSSGSEANTLAFLGLASAHPKKKRIIISAVEHTSVIESAHSLKKKGYTIDILGVDKNGKVDPSELENKLGYDVLLVSVMMANNEVGTIQSVIEIGKKIEQFHKKSGQRYPFFHTDSCQAAGSLSISPNRLRVDLLTFNGSKIHGPRGCGVLYIRKGISLPPLILGGGQESGRRAGTEDLPAIAGLAKAVGLKTNTKKIAVLRDLFISGVEREISDVQLNGPRGDVRLANNINFSFKGLESEAILVELDKYGIYAGSGSACTSRSVEPSHVLKAMGVSPGYLHGAVRFSLSKETTKKDIEYTVKMLTKVIKTLRSRYGRRIEKK